MIEAATKTCKMCDQPVRSKRSVYCSVACFHRYESEYTTRRRATFSPERKRAGTLVYEAVQRGDLKPSPCEVCGNNLETHAHHDDYAKPLEVRWLCRSCHKRHHAEHGPGKNA
jgi:hypothetical protein